MTTQEKFKSKKMSMVHKQETKQKQIGAVGTKERLFCKHKGAFFMTLNIQNFYQANEKNQNTKKNDVYNR